MPHDRDRHLPEWPPSNGGAALSPPRPRLRSETDIVQLLDCPETLAGRLQPKRHVHSTSPAVCHFPIAA